MTEYRPDLYAAWLEKQNTSKEWEHVTDIDALIDRQADRKAQALKRFGAKDVPGIGIVPA